MLPRLWGCKRQSRKWNGGDSPVFLPLLFLRYRTQYLAFHGVRVTGGRACYRHVGKRACVLLKSKIDSFRGLAKKVLSFDDLYDGLVLCQVLEEMFAQRATLIIEMIPSATQMCVIQSTSARRSRERYSTRFNPSCKATLWTTATMSLFSMRRRSM